MFSDSKYDQMFKKTQKLRPQIKTDVRQIQNYLNYQMFKIKQQKFSQRAKVCCGTKQSQDIKINKQFKNAYLKLDYHQKIVLYSKTCEHVRLCLIGQNNKINEQLTKEKNQIKKFVLYREGLIFTQWSRYSINLNLKYKTILINNTKQLIDLHDFLIRKSKCIDKKSFVLEPMKNLDKYKTMRIAPSLESQYDQLYQLIQKVNDTALLQNMSESIKIRAINKQNDKNMIKQGSKQDPIQNVQYDNNNPQNLFHAMKALIIQEKPSQNSPVAPKSNLNNKSNIHHVHLDKIITNHFIEGLKSLQNYKKVRNGVYYQKNGLKVRKIYQFKGQDVKIDQLVDILFDQSKFYKWKPTLKAVMDPQTTQSQKKEKKIIYQLHHFPQSKIEQGYIYDRRHYIKGDAQYIVDINHNKYVEQADSVLKGSIQYIAWQIKRKNEKNIQLIIEGSIDHLLKQQLNQRMTDQFLGQIDIFIENKNMREAQLLNVPHQNHNKDILHADDFVDDLSQISKERTEYFTINSRQPSVQQHEQKLLLASQNSFKLIKKQSIEKNDKIQSNFKIKINPRIGPIDCHTFQHIINPLPAQPVKRLVSLDNGHYHFGKDWLVKTDGNLTNINQAMIKQQNSVLAIIVKRIGRNILSGKGIMNTSLPVNVFSKESFLETFCKSFSYAPRYLEKAAKENIVQKFKAAFKVMIGIAMLNIQMQKPFNPILGETYQGLIDGCPIYGQQISHHPPISAIFMKGRGYFIHGSRQPQIDIGLRSALGVMHGELNIAFHDSDWNKNKITFTGTTGQIKGLIFGERLVRTAQQTIMFDIQNKVYCCFKHGSGTLKGPLSKHQNTFEGKLLKIKQSSYFDFRQKKKRPGKTDIQVQLGTFHGKWTDKCYFNDELIWDYNNDPPCVVDKYPHVFESDCSRRKDLILRVALDWENAQDAKQQMQQLQRHDRKLRKQAQDLRKKNTKKC